MEQPKPGAIKPLNFLKEVKTELSKVIWPTKKEAIRLTTIVIGISIAVGIYISSLDFIFTKTIGLLLQK